MKLIKDLVADLTHFVPDELYLKMVFRIKMHKKLDLTNPSTLNEKLQWLKLHDRREVYTIMVDKFEAKRYVGDLIGPEYTIPTIGIYDSFDQIDFESLPKQFVIKTTHDSGTVFICKSKDVFDVDGCKKNDSEEDEKESLLAN